MIKSAGPIRICIGTEEKTRLMQKVLEYSILSRTKAEVKFTPLIDNVFWEYPKNIKCGTGFSLRRWLIPEYFKWEGRAIYLDADQIVLGDIAELWSMPEKYPCIAMIPPCCAWTTHQSDKFSEEPRPRTDVMVIDCEAAYAAGFGWRRDYMFDYLRKHPEKYAAFMHASWMDPYPVRIPTSWNHLNAYDPQRTRLLHFTKADKQPVYEPKCPFADLWQKELQATIIAGRITKKEFELALSKWQVQEDWRKQNGLHPWYRGYLKLFA